MYKEVFENCIPMLEIVGAYGIVYLLNCLFGIYTNCIVSGQTFVAKKTLCSLLKIALAAFSGIGTVVGFNLFSMSLTSFGFNVNEMLQETLSVVTFVALFYKAFIETAKDLFEKIKNLTEVQLTIEEAKDIELKYQKPKIEAPGTSANGTTIAAYKEAHPEYNENSEEIEVG